MPDTTAPKRKILVADDAPEQAFFLVRTLRKRGYDVMHAADGEECLIQVDTFKPELVILDIMMPKVHGMDVLKTINSRTSGPPIGVIICSARSFKPDVDQAKALGAYDFLTKPLELPVVLEKVEGYFANRPPATVPSAETDAPAVRPASREVYAPALDLSAGYWKLWGTRGSIPVTGPNYLRHGGNTSCLEVRCGEHLAIIDAGTGIRDLGVSLMAEESGPKKIHLLIGHTHWDHIQGFPFFTPVYVPGYDVAVYGASGFGKDLRSIFQGQLDRDYFPVEMSEMSAKLSFFHLADNPVRVGPLSIYWEFMNHPGATVGFRIETDKYKVGYITDNEFLKGYLGPPNRLPTDTILVPFHKIIDFVSGVDLLISEAQYLNEEYASKIGWGHSSLSNACLLAKLAKVKKWVIIHHDPMHTDDFLQQKLNLTRQILHSIDCDIDVTHGYDGMTGPF